MEVTLGPQPFTVTEREWFRTQLRLLCLEHRGPKFITKFVFKMDHNKHCFLALKLEDEVHVICHIWCTTTSELVKKKESRDKQLEYYVGWVHQTKALIKPILQQLPALCGEFSLERNMVFLILDDYGMGSAEVCRFIGNQVVWLADRIGKKAKS